MVVRGCGALYIGECVVAIDFSVGANYAGSNHDGVMENVGGVDVGCGMPYAVFHISERIIKRQC